MNIKITFLVCIVAEFFCWGHVALKISELLCTQTPKQMSGLELLTDQGLRIDGRKPSELRRIRCSLGIFAQADGSAYLEQGNTKILAAVYGPHEVGISFVNALCKMIFPLTCYLESPIRSPVRNQRHHTITFWLTASTALRHSLPLKGSVAPEETEKARKCPTT